MMLVGTSTVENFSYKAQDIYGCDNDTRTSYNRQCPMEHIEILERTDKNSHFGNETAQSRKSEVGKTGNDVTYRQERHYFHQPVQFANVTCVGTSVDHTDQCKEQGCHQSVRQHLEYSTCTSRLVHHQNGKKYQAAVAYGRVGIDVFQVCLHTSGECTIHYGDTGQYQENPS